VESSVTRQWDLPANNAICSEPREVVQKVLSSNGSLPPSIEEIDYSDSLSRATPSEFCVITISCLRCFVVLLFFSASFSSFSRLLLLVLVLCSGDIIDPVLLRFCVRNLHFYPIPIILSKNRVHKENFQDLEIYTVDDDFIANVIWVLRKHEEASSEKFCHNASKGKTGTNKS
jgi:hypothetical protein